MVSEYGANAGVSGSLSVSGSVTFKGDSDVDVDSNTFYVDASENSVGIGTTAPIASLDVAGKIAISSESSTPSQPADGKGYLYTKTDGKLYWRSYDLGETDLTAAGSGISHDGSTADGVLTYKDSDEATVESGLTFNGTTLLASADDVRIRLNGDTNSHPGLELAEDGTRKWIVYNNYTNDDLTFKTDSNIRMVIEQDGDVKIGTGDLYVDKIRRASDSDTTTKILLNDEAIKLYAGHSTDNICTIDSTGLKIDNGSLETATIDYTDGDLSMTIADGGKVTFAAGFDVGSDAAGDILYHNGTSHVRLAKGTADQVLTMNDAATAPNWEDASGGGNEYYHITLSGRVKNTSGELFGHAAYPYNAGDADWATSLASHTSNWSSGDTTFTGTYTKAMLYWTIGVAPAAMSLTSARIAYYMANDNMSDDYIWEVWKATPTTATAYSTDLTWTRLGYIDRGGDPASETFYAATGSISGSNSLAAGDLIGLTVHNPGDTYTSKYHGYHLALRFTYS